LALRLHFQEKLDEIRAEVIRVGGDSCDMVRRSVDATLNGDTELAREVIAADDHIDAFERRMLAATVTAVMQEAPVANDLRFLVSTLGVIGEIESVGDDAVKLARRATKLQGGFPAEMRVSLMDLGEQARRQFSAGLRLYAEYNVELAHSIIEGDTEIDTAYSRARNGVFEMIRKNPDATSNLVRIIECFHALEHVADHAVAIASRMRMLHEA
jgi:phosphate transport system protein